MRQNMLKDRNLAENNTKLNNAKSIGSRNIKTNAHGITLIALVITIIVLLILAGVSISAITGNDSAMEKAKQAKTASEKGDELDTIKLAVVDAVAHGTTGYVTGETLANALTGSVLDATKDAEQIADIRDNAEGPWLITTKLGNSYEVNANGEVEPAATPTDIYVTLDGDTLRFYSQKDNVSGTLYIKDNEPYNLKGIKFTSPDQVPWYTNDRTNIKNVSIEEEIAPTSTQDWFYNCTNLTNISNIERLHTDCVTSMGWMFYGCSGLTQLDVSKFNTRNVTQMKSMFCGCSGLTQLDVSKFKTGNVTNMASMFWNCSNLTTLDVSNFKTGKVEDMSYMFGGYNVTMKFNTLNVSRWDTSNVLNMSTMFQNCTGLTELDLSNWDTAKVNNMSYMFWGCSNITTIYAGDKWNTDAVTASTEMFNNCSNLKGGEGTNYDSSYKDKTRAKIDGTEAGYFTDINSKGKPKVGDYIKLSAGQFDSDTGEGTANKVATKLNALSNVQGTTTTVTNLTRDTANDNYLTWRVLEVDPTTKQPTKIISADTLNAAGINLNGANGYNNAVYLLNGLCQALYTTNLGTTRSIKIEDIEKHIADGAIPDKVGQTIEYDSNTQYPAIAGQESGIWLNGNNTQAGSLGKSEQSEIVNDGKVTDATKLKITHTSYGINGWYQLKYNTSKNQLYESIFKPSRTSHWIATRFVSDESSFCRFQIGIKAAELLVTSQDMFYSRNFENGSTLGIRPIITLNSGVRAVGEGSTHNTPETAWALTN